MKIGIIGSGLMGSKLGTLFSRAGHSVIFSYSRSKHKLQNLAENVGGSARAGTVEEAAEDSDVLLMAVPWSSIDDVLKQAGNLSGKIIISCSLPMNKANSELTIAHTSSGAEELARKAPKAHIVLAFNAIPSEVLFSVYKAKEKKKYPRPHVVYCGDHDKSNRTAAKLIEDVGFEPLYVGPLKRARLLEPFALLVGHLAYDGGAGPELAYRFDHFNS